MLNIFKKLFIIILILYIAFVSNDVCLAAESFQADLEKTIKFMIEGISKGKKISVLPIANSDDEITDLSKWLRSEIEAVISNTNLVLKSKSQLSQLINEKESTSSEMIDLDQEFLKLKTDYCICATYCEISKNIEFSLSLHEMSEFRVVSKRSFSFKKTHSHKVKMAKIRGSIINNNQVALVSIGGDNQNLKVFVEMDKPSYNVGDAGSIEVKCNFNCYINVFVIGADGSVAHIFPNGYTGSNFIANNVVRKIPNASDKKQGMKNFRFFLIDGINEARERVKVIASKEPVSFNQFLKPVNRTFSVVNTRSVSSLIEELKTLPSAIWTEAVVSYWIEE
ncbi:hypothetical protein GMMP15_1580013 [Candidatus Magnetomoraceae bacterium gMMP-15]